MVELAEIFRHAAPAYRERFGARIPPSHQRAIEDVVLCRTPALGGSLYECDDCGSLDYAYHSCRNRHCPKCQEDRAQSWLERLRARLLPCNHYLLTFTLPAQLRPLARSNQRLVYSILMREAAATIQSLADDPSWVGGRLAILAVLHTWSRSLDYHPHVHLLVSAGGLSPDGTAWRKPAHPRFLAPGYVLSPIFRAKVRDAFSRAGLHTQIDPQVWSLAWSVHVQRIGNGEHAALYLSRYVYRVALTNQRIERFQDEQVTFRYTHARTSQTRRLSLPVHHFLARFLQHVLPRGFAKIRYYGLLSPGCRANLERARRLLTAAQPRPGPSLPAPEPSHLTPASEPGHSTSSTVTDPASVLETTRHCRVCERGSLQLLRVCRRPRAPPR